MNKKLKQIFLFLAAVSLSAGLAMAQSPPVDSGLPTVEQLQEKAQRQLEKIQAVQEQRRKAQGEITEHSATLAKTVKQVKQKESALLLQLQEQERALNVLKRPAILISVPKGKGNDQTTRDIIDNLKKAGVGGGNIFIYEGAIPNINEKGDIFLIVALVNGEPDPNKFQEVAATNISSAAQDFLSKLSNHGPAGKSFVAALAKKPPVDAAASAPASVPQTPPPVPQKVESKTPANQPVSEALVPPPVPPKKLVESKTPANQPVSEALVPPPVPPKKLKVVYYIAAPGVETERFKKLQALGGRIEIKRIDCVDGYILSLPNGQKKKMPCPPSGGSIIFIDGESYDNNEFNIWYKKFTSQ